MAIDVKHRGPLTLSLQVAEEIRVVMLRRGITGARLAQELGVSPAWVSYRLTGAQPIDLNDLERIADAIGIGPGELLPARIRKATDGQPEQVANDARPGIDPLAARVVATIGETRPGPRTTLVARPPAHTGGRRLDQPRRPDRTGHTRRPVSIVAQPARALTH